MRPFRIYLTWTAAVVGVYAAPVDINVGRQLFVDDDLVESTDGVVRHWNKPVKIDTPLVWPGAGMKSFPTTRSTPEDAAVNLTCATDGGLWWDPVMKRFRLWYQADWCGNICYAESADGIVWNYPDLGIVPGTNRLFEKDNIDSWSVTPDYASANPYAAWKLHISAPGGVTDDGLWSSADGIHFTPLGLAGRSGDRSTSYYDPFRGVWVFSLREGRKGVGRARRYFASRTFGGEDCHWSWPKDKKPDALKGYPVPEEWLVATNGVRRSLYSFNAVAYESLMLGVMEILYNTPGDNGDCEKVGLPKHYNTPGDNGDCEKVGLPKQTGLHFTFSRNGKTYEPRTDADIAPEGWGTGKWDTGYLSCIGGICVIKDERLWFYYSGLRGDGARIGKKKYRWQRNGMYSNGSIGAATLRRTGSRGWWRTDAANSSPSRSSSTAGIFSSTPNAASVPLRRRSWARTGCPSRASRVRTARRLRAATPRRRSSSSRAARFPRSRASPCVFASSCTVARSTLSGCRPRRRASRVATWRVAVRRIPVCATCPVPRVPVE